MSQQYSDYDKALAGMKYGLESDVSTAAAKAVIQFGEPVLRAVGDEVGGYPLDKIRVTLSADLVASNAIVPKILGLTLATITFANSHAATFAALVTALDAVDGVDIVASDATARTIDIRTTGKATGFGLTITGGASQPAVGIALASDRVLGGVALRVQKARTSDVLGARYEVTDPVNVMTAGGLWVETDAAVNAFAPAYLTTSGKWSMSATGTIATKYKFESTLTAAGLAQLSVIK